MLQHAVGIVDNVDAGCFHKAQQSHVCSTITGLYHLCYCIIDGKLNCPGQKLQWSGISHSAVVVCDFDLVVKETRMFIFECYQRMGEKEFAYTRKREHHVFVNCSATFNSAQ